MYIDIDINTYILCIDFDASFPPGTSLKGMNTQKSLYLSLSPQFFRASSIPLPLSATRAFLYSFTLSFYPAAALLLLLDPQFHSCIHVSSVTLLSSFSPYDETTLTYFFSPIALHHISLHLHKVLCHIFNTCFHYSHPPIVSRLMVSSNN